MHNTSQAKSFDKRRGRYSVEIGIKFKKRCERKTVTRENGNSILRSNGYVNLKDREEHIQKLQGRVSRRKSYIDYLQEKIIHMYSCELDKSLSHKVTRDTLLLEDGSWNKNVPFLWTLKCSQVFKCLSKILYIDSLLSQESWL